MESIKDILNKKEFKKQKLSERAGVVKEFVDEINKERIFSKKKPVTGVQIAIKTSHLSLNELYYFLSICRDYKNRKGSFGKCFFGSLKVEK